MMCIPPSPFSPLFFHMPQEGSQIYWQLVSSLSCFYQDDTLMPVDKIYALLNDMMHLAAVQEVDAIFPSSDSHPG